MLQHEVMVADEWQDLLAVSLCIQTAFNKLNLCSLSVAYACPYHNPTAAMGHSVLNIDISKPLAHTTPHTVCHLPGTVKTGIHPWRELLQRAKHHGCASQLLPQLSGWLVSDDLAGEEAGYGGPGLVWLHVVCSCDAGWMYCQILRNDIGDGLW